MPDDLEFPGEAPRLITVGPAVKALGEGKVAGYLVQWGSEATKDGDGEWFTPETDFETEFPHRCSVRYHHGLDRSVGPERLAYGKMDRDERGIHVEVQLDLSQPKHAAVYRKAEKGELGWSSAALPIITLPPRDRRGGPIELWAGIAYDASLTPIPSDRRNVAFAVKAAPVPPVVEPLLTDDLPPSLVEDLDRVADQVERVTVRCAGIKAGRSQFSASRRERIARLRDELTALLEETQPAETPAAPPASLPSPAADRSGEGAEAWGAIPDLSDLYVALTHQEDRGLSIAGRI